MKKKFLIVVAIFCAYTSLAKEIMVKCVKNQAAPDGTIAIYTLTRKFTSEFFTLTGEKSNIITTYSDHMPCDFGNVSFECVEPTYSYEHSSFVLTEDIKTRTYSLSHVFIANYHDVTPEPKIWLIADHLRCEK